VIRVATASPLNIATKSELKKSENILNIFQGLLFEIRLTGTMRQKLDSEALITRAASGDAAAFRSLLDTHYDRVFRVVYSVVRNQSDAEDITQDIWAAMPAKLRHWRGEAKVTSWLHRIALNAAKDSLRKSATRARKTAGYAEVQSLSRGEAADTEKRLSEAAEVLGIAEGTVAWRMSEIKRRLKTLASKDNGLGKEALA